MFNIALRNLFQEKTRLAISVGGVAFSVTHINDPKLILAGEPTANLDSKAGHDKTCQHHGRREM